MDPLAWLPAYPDLGAAIGEARRTPDAALRLARVAALAGFRRDFTLTGRLDRIATNTLAELARDRAAPAPAPGSTSLRIALLASHTVDHLVPAIRVAALQRRITAQVHVAPYGMVRQSLFGDDAELAAFAPQLIVLALDAHEAPIQLPLDASEAQVAEAVQAHVGGLRQLWRFARDRYSAQVVQQTFVAAQPPLFGGFEQLVPAAPRSIVDRLNAGIRDAARDDGVLLLDLAWLTALGGGEGQGVADPVRWHQAKQLISPTLAPLYGDLLARVAAASVGLSRKCLVLDLDNTLWGGVIGDDGIHGIRLGQGNPTGEAFLAFQRYVALLAQRGIVLAVCSKNDETVAAAAFEHPEMALKRSDIAAFVANWDDKAGNLRRIAAMLNIGLDSLVFVDDNPAERDIVRRELPEVAVPELPEDVAGYPARLAAGGYFEAVSFTSDDLTRGRNYGLNAERNAALEQATDMDGYLKSLQMKLTATPIGPAELARATQLVNKTNQFNLTTRRYTEAEVERLAADSAAVTLAVRLSDRFGDNGLISVVLARPDARLAEDELLVDTWLMSCRVLGRQVEQAVLEVLAREAGQRGAVALVGEYRTSARNAMVAQHYPKLGFSPRSAPSGEPSEASFWHYDLRSGALPPHFIEVASI